MYLFYLKMIFQTKNNIVSKNCKMELIISTKSSNMPCNSDDQVWIVCTIFGQLSLAQRGNTQKANHQHYLRPRQIYLRYLAIQSKRVPMSNLLNSSYKTKSSCKNMLTFLSNDAMLNPFSFLLSFFKKKQTSKQTKKKIRLCDYAVPLLNGKWKDIHTWNDCPESCNCWDKM
ncbi:hypothetical protein RFI_37153 [Reticulomyxa filosa]|uniref:Uncharacterized protein n=1 Tax=Reticulomyxa filosa TaxID=46433 RepID=X6LFF3_RETFI|nr:hypothetical protein RFI_37153 [Reticulomyxa filosa]|eukprot:ETO00294.1 hypothetical protein RFI_37153 [Reticulomyxa filosa]